MPPILAAPDRDSRLAFASTSADLIEPMLSFPLPPIPSPVTTPPPVMVKSPPLISLSLIPHLLTFSL